MSNTTKAKDGAGILLAAKNMAEHGTSDNSQLISIVLTAAKHGELAPLAVLNNSTNIDLSDGLLGSIIEHASINGHLHIVKWAMSVLPGRARIPTAAVVNNHTNIVDYVINNTDYDKDDIHLSLWSAIHHGSIDVAELIYNVDNNAFSKVPSPLLVSVAHANSINWVITRLNDGAKLSAVLEILPIVVKEGDINKINILSEWLNKLDPD